VATVSRIEISGAHDLKSLQETIRQQEGIFGPLISLHCQGNDNVVTFEVGASPDVNSRALLAIYDRHPAEMGGHVVICAGACLVDRQRRLVAAYRKTT
jgi:hypothetical protein